MKTTTSILAALALASTAFAGDKVVSSHKDYRAPEPECFRAHELQLDLFGQYSIGNGPDHAGTFRDHGWGGGLGINYFFTRNLGLGVDAAWLSAKEAPYSASSTDRTEIHNFSASLICRFPIDRICVAPYLFAGGGFAV